MGRGRGGRNHAAVSLSMPLVSELSGRILFIFKTLSLK